MSHHVCSGGCGGSSDAPAVCQADTCELKGQQMVECNCEDNQHAEVTAQAEPAAAE
jgi:hypothetical protein